MKPQPAPAGKQMSQELIEALAKLKLEPVLGIDNWAIFKGESDDFPSGTRFCHIPLDEIETVEECLVSLSPKPLEDRYGYTILGKIYECEISFDSLRMSPPIIPRLTYGNPGCSHYLPPSIDLADTDDFPTRAHRLHVTDPEQEICIEVSPASGMGEIFGRGSARTPRFPKFLNEFRRLTAKVFTQKCSTHEELTELGSSLVDSLLYELAVRNSVAGQPIYRRMGPHQKLPDAPTDTPVRFPKVKIPSEVAQLFTAGMRQPTKNLYAFLSFYQILEFHFPNAMNGHIIRKVRNELLDPTFAPDDAQVLRIIGIAADAARPAESAQIATLVEDWVRSDKLIEFFSAKDSIKHFGSNGPISGVEHINPNNKTKSISKQVADRVYSLRNRIVHAKDDPKYAETKVLLPSSRESQFIGPDVDLVRLLAQEVVTYIQMHH